MFVEVRNWKDDTTARVEQVEQHRLARKTAEYRAPQLMDLAAYALDCPNPPPFTDGSIDVDLEGL